MTENARHGLDPEELAALVVALLCRAAQPPAAAAPPPGGAPKSGWRTPGMTSGFVVAHSWQTTTHP
ncbi:acyl-CoA carboxylase epsilon subunit [Amycolatopsis australiensis]|uniref:Acyl-CoA carboxylase epsilon subunit n=1 Tax=Amycolatopsis australiensis TaxID=546364 RepID=A0A1K1S2P0_9PSEU|nr:acyl-CoA carboxylase epsilon subunit [Amycolatopsis australiensis]SFW78364.1 Acyl-CoA carboxylase epsilon subunit [Amycolatopsis australiensis]